MAFSPLWGALLLFMFSFLLLFTLDRFLLDTWRFGYSAGSGGSFQENLLPCGLRLPMAPYSIGHVGSLGISYRGLGAWRLRSLWCFLFRETSPLLVMLLSFGLFRLTRRLSLLFLPVSTSYSD
ncbi:hypothetical protein NL676_013436 [Syzygium grande]|nr:hypothetical protein NL676_013436 [Syzygium grande]